jgi:hypothetical protein
VEGESQERGRQRCLVIALLPYQVKGTPTYQQSYIGAFYFFPFLCSDTDGPFITPTYWLFRLARLIVSSRSTQQSNRCCRRLFVSRLSSRLSRISHSLVVTLPLSFRACTTCHAPFLYIFGSLLLCVTRISRIPQAPDVISSRSLVEWKYLRRNNNSLDEHNSWHFSTVDISLSLFFTEPALYFRCLEASQGGRMTYQSQVNETTERRGR